MNKNADLDAIAKKINDWFQLDIFENTRKRRNVDARSIFCYIAKYYYQRTLCEIENYFEANNKSYDHTTAVHAIKQFEVVLKYNKDAERLLNEILAEVDVRAHIQSVFDQIMRNTRDIDLFKLKSQMTTLQSKMLKDDKPRDIREIEVKEVEVR